MVTLSEMETRTPIVRWAQNGGRIDLTIELIDAKKPQIEWTETGLKFTGFGAGARGENLYQFSLKFYSKIDYQSCKQKVTDRSISLQAWKQVKTEEWPRLLKSQQKPAWLKIDFDKWKVEDSETEGENIPDINKISFEQRIKSEVEKAKDDIWIYAKMAWLTIYNLLQAICFSIIFTKILILFAKHGKDQFHSLNTANVKSAFIINSTFTAAEQAASLYVYDDISDLLLTCQLAAFVEILNPLFGIVKTGLVAPTMQISILPYCFASWSKRNYLVVTIFGLGGFVSGWYDLRSVFVSSQAYVDFKTKKAWRQWPNTDKDKTVVDDLLD